MLPAHALHALLDMLQQPHQVLTVLQPVHYVLQTTIEHAHQEHARAMHAQLEQRLQRRRPWELQPLHVHQVLVLVAQQAQLLRHVRHAILETLLVQHAILEAI